MKICEYFNAQVSGTKYGNFVDPEIFVVDVDAVTLISRKTAMQLGILKIVVQTVREQILLLQRYITYL